MRTAPSRATVWSRLYRVALWIYPRHFREHVGHDMLACFADLAQRARAERGRIGEFVVFVRTLLELPRSALAARVSRDRIPPDVADYDASTSSKTGLIDMNAWLRDSRMAVRSLVKRPLFTVLAVFSLAIGVGANTTMFSTVNAILWQQLPVPEAEELVRIYQYRDGYSSVSYPNFADVRDQADVFDGMFLHQLETFGLTHDGESQVIHGEVVSASYFDVLGVQPALGRFFSPDESDYVGAAPVVVLSHSLWRRSFGGNADVVGTVIRLNGHAVTVLGVAPDGFDGTKFGLGMDAWVPAKIWGEFANWGNWLENRGSRRLNAVARLSDGVTMEQAERAMTLIAGRLQSAYPVINSNLGLRLFPERTLAPGAGTLPNLIGILAVGASVLVLLVACANVASLLFARGVTRRKEFSIRLALGAGRGGIVRQLLAENSLIALLGGTVGVAVSFWTAKFIYLFLPVLPYRFVLNATPDGRVLALASLMSLAALFVFGLTPAIQASRADAGLVVKSDTAGAGSNLQRTRAFDSVVVTMVSLSFVTLVLSVLFGKSLSNVRGLDPGLAIDNRLLATFDVSLGGLDIEEGTAYLQQLEEQVAALPGVQGAGFISHVPLGDSQSSSRVYATDRTYDADALGVRAWRASVSGSFFATAQIPLLQGRGFNSGDHRDAPTVVIVNEALANEVWSETDVVGRRLTFSSVGDGASFEVIGVVPTGKYYSMGEDPQPALFFNHLQARISNAELMVHTDAGFDPVELTGAVRRTSQDINASVPMYDVRTLQAHLHGSLWMYRLGAGVGGAMGLLALGLAAAGLYGIMAFSVNQRIRELGIRVALGARSKQVLVLVLRKGALLAGIGIVIGAVLSMTTSGMIGRMLFGVRPIDVLAFGSVAIGLVVVAVLATLIPATVATRADPVKALRSQ